VWPIQQLDSRSLTFESLGCIGFLAVDCAAPNRFREQSDVPLGAGIADAMFHCFRLWNALRAAPRQPPAEEQDGEEFAQFGQGRA